MNKIFIERIEQYLNGEMSLEAEENFKSDLITDKELAKSFEIYKALETTMTLTQAYEDRELALKDTVSQLNAIYFQEKDHSSGAYVENRINKTVPKDQSKTDPLQNQKSKESIGGWIRLAVAAAIITAVSLGIAIYNRENGQFSKDKSTTVIVKKDQKTDSLRYVRKTDGRLSKDTPTKNLAATGVKTSAGEKDSAQKEYLIKNTELFARNFTPDLVPEEKEGPLQDAFDYYENKNYRKAVAAIEISDPNEVLRGQQMDLKHTNFYAAYYKGISYLALNAIPKAIPELNKATALSPEDSLLVKAKWYLALAYLRNDDIKHSVTLLREVSDSDVTTTYKKKATALLRKLQKF